MSETLKPNMPDHDYVPDAKLAEQKAIELNKLAREIEPYPQPETTRTYGEGSYIGTIKSYNNSSREYDHRIESVDVEVKRSKMAKPDSKTTEYRYLPYNNGDTGFVQVYEGDELKRRHRGGERGARLAAAVINRALNDISPKVVSKAEEKQRKIAEGLEKLKS